MRKIPIDIDEPLQPGDRIELTFKRFGIGVIDTTIGMLIEKKLRSNPQYELYDWDITDKQAIYRIRIKEPEGPEIQQASIGSIIALITVAGLGTLAFGWALTKVEKIIDAPAVVAGSVGLAVIAIIVLLTLLKRK